MTKHCHAGYLLLAHYLLSRILRVLTIKPSVFPTFHVSQSIIIHYQPQALEPNCLSFPHSYSSNGPSCNVDKFYLNTVHHLVSQPFTPSLVDRGKLTFPLVFRP